MRSTRESSQNLVITDLADPTAEPLDPRDRSSHASRGAVFQVDPHPLGLVGEVAVVPDDYVQAVISPDVANLGGRWSALRAAGTGPPSCRFRIRRRCVRAKTTRPNSVTAGTVVVRLLFSISISSEERQEPQGLWMLAKSAR